MPGQIQFRARTELDHAEARATWQHLTGADRAHSARYEGSRDLLDEKPQIGRIQTLPESAALLVDLGRSRIEGEPTTARQSLHFQQPGLFRKAVQMNAE